MRTVRRGNKSRGRRAGGTNRGYFFRSGRGWTVTGTSFVLLSPTGQKLRNRNTPETILRDSYLRYRLESENARRAAADSDNQVPLSELCRAYLDWQQNNGACSTYQIRRKYLVDFCTGVPADRGAEKRIHKGYGGIVLANLTKLDVEQWCAAHKTWGHGTVRVAKQSLLRAINWAVEMNMPGVKLNPIKGLKVGKPRKRVTYFSPELEAAMLKKARPAFALALKVLIRTGARYNCEFAKLTAGNVVNVAPGRQEWRWPQGTKVKGKARVIRVVDAELINLVNDLCRRYPHDAIFRNQFGKPWDASNLKKCFSRLRKSLRKKGWHFDPDDCLYTTRHTYAKRMLGGYWTGKGVTIEVLASLMGNSRDVCWEHYADWCDRYTDPLWDALA